MDGPEPMEHLPSFPLPSINYIIVFTNFMVIPRKYLRNIANEGLGGESK